MPGMAASVTEQQHRVRVLHVPHLTNATRKLTTQLPARSSQLGSQLAALQHAHSTECTVDTVVEECRAVAGRRDQKGEGAYAG